MFITNEEIQHIAELSRLELSEEEIKEIGGQLNSILRYVGQLSEVNTKGVEPTAQVGGLSDVWRADDICKWDESEKEAALSQGDREAGQIKVKRVL